MKIICNFLLILCVFDLLQALEVEFEFRLESNCWNSQTKAEDFCLSCIIYNANLNDNGEEFVINTEKNTQSNLDVKRVKFEGQKIYHLPINQILETFPNVENINLFHTGNEITINSPFLGNSSQVKYLSFLGNSIKLQDNSFASATSLEKLNFENNELEIIPGGAFLGLKSLVNLDLSMNQLSRVDPAWLQDLHNLEDLNLEWNLIKKINDGVFKNLHNLKVLRLGLNQLEMISNKIFAENLKLEKLTLHNNKIVKIQAGAFKSLMKLQELELSDNICVGRHFEGPDLTIMIEASILSCIPNPGTSFLF